MRFNILLSAVIISLAIFSIGSRFNVLAQGLLVKGSSSAVYYVGSDGKRYVFPNDKTYFTWYADFSGVTTVSDAQLAAYAIGGNVTYRPGTRLVKIQSDPKVYAVDIGGILRWVSSESAATTLFGSNWNTQVDDLSDSFFVNYQVGTDISSASDFSPVVARGNAMTIDSDKKLVVSGSNGNVNAPATPPTPTGPICGNGKVEGTEQCDGGDRCSSSCVWTTKYQAISFNQPGGSSDYTVGVGDKIAIGDGINIRIDDISNTSSSYGSRVNYSIWGKDTNLACKLVSASGVFWTNMEGYNFREFADSFLELISVDGAKATIRQYYGNAARVRCDAIAGWKQSLACSMYPSNNHYFVNNGDFSSFYYGADDQLAAEYYADAFKNCRQAYIKKIPALASIAPIGRSYRQLYSALESVNAYSTDYERVFISKAHFDPNDPSSSGISQKLSWISDNSCPMQEDAIAHELAHMLFARTFLQGVYDGGTKPEWTDVNAYKEPGSITAQEGFAQYMTTFISKDSPSAAAKTSSDYWSSFCGKDHLLNAHPGDFYDFSKATTDQMSYKNIFEGSGYGANTYQAGYCFYKRIDDDCGDASLTDLLNKAIQYDGSMAAHPTMFKYLSDSCSTDKVASIMNDFGFDSALVTMTQKWPNTGFPNGLDQMGCLTN